MKSFVKPFAYTMAAWLLGVSPLSFAHGNFRPDSSIENLEDPGFKVHTHIRIVHVTQDEASSRNSIKPSFRPFATGLPPYTGYLIETPASLACIYGLTGLTAATISGGCHPQQVTIRNPVVNAGSRAIAIVDACSYPTALADLQKFSTQFGLVVPKTLSVVNANGTPNCTSSDGPSGWQLEASLDLQWAHAMAPNATLYLVVAKNSSTTELLKAVDRASNLVAAAGGGQVSMSWGSSEFFGQGQFDTHFQTANVIYLASAGDSPGTSWPSTSPYVIGVGGTTINRNSSTGQFLSESVWANTGGGLSTIAANTRPVYQNVVQAKVGAQRGSPDVASVADPNNAAWVYNSSYNNQPGWYAVGGTSWSAPTIAGIMNAAGHFAVSSVAELTAIYGNIGTTGVAANFRDITSGSCGLNKKYWGATGWDFCTGVGTDWGYVGK